MRDEIIFDTMFTEEEYHALPDNIKAECMAVDVRLNGHDGMTVFCEGGVNGKVFWRGAATYPYMLHPNSVWYAHRSQHRTSMSASGLVVRYALDERKVRMTIWDASFIDRLVWVEYDEGRAAGRYGWLKTNGDDTLQAGFHHAFPGWANQTVGLYYTRKLTQVKPYGFDVSSEALRRMKNLLRVHYPQVVHPLGFAWISEVRWNKRKEQVEAKVLDTRWLPVMHPGQDVKAVMQQLQQQGFVQWDVTMLRHPQHGTGETFA
ncbi:hypothetical protein ACMG5L_24240 [Escherichia coli]|uniref:hypothetical protein n=1 Tax=Escherichia coli TaxID=562 RepID=UPI0039BF03B5